MFSLTHQFIVKIHLYAKPHVSALHSHYQASTEEQIHIKFYLYFIQVSWAFLVVVCEAGDVLATFTLTYFGITFLTRYYKIKFDLVLFFSRDLIMAV